MTDKPECACGNCNWTGSTNDVEDIRDLWSRIEAGDPFPVGDCPDCGCFVHMIEVPKITLREASLMVALNELIGAATWAYDDASDAGECFDAFGTEYDSCQALREARDKALATVAKLYPVAADVAADEACNLLMYGEESHGEITQKKT